MSQSVPSQPNSIPTANEELAAQIAAALRTAGFIAVAEEAAIATLLATGNAKAGDWRRVLEKNLPATSTPTATDHAPAHHAA